MSQVKDYLTFTGGIITDASPLSFPENASVDEYNCVLYRDGSRSRRLGLDVEDNAVWNTVTGVEGFRWNSMEWLGAGDNSELRFVVIQAGSQLYFFEGESESFSDKLIYIYNFPDPSPITTGLKVEGVSVMGDFVVTNAGLPIVFKYDAATNTITHNFIQIAIRDVFGVVDGLAINENPAALSIEHNYNLLNQGWSKRPTGTSPPVAVSIYPDLGSSVIYATSQQTLSNANITAYEAATNFYPDNTQIWWAGKNADDDFSPTALDKIDFGTTAAPKGRVILDAFNRGASRKAVWPSGTSLPDDQELGRPSALCFAFQRIWYAGVKSAIVDGDDNSPVMTGFVFHSRTLRNHYDLGICYPAADPCSEYDAQIVDTDGGFINIPDSGQIYRIANISDAVFVFAQFGVWMIRGGQDGFTASNYSVSKLTEFGVSSPESIVIAGDSAFYWSDSGIFTLTASGEQAGVSNITETTISALLDAIPESSKQYVTGNYDPINRRVSWLLNVGDYVEGFVETFNNELILDLNLGAFYRHSYLVNNRDLFVSGYAMSRVFLPVPDSHKSRVNTVVKYLVVNTETNGQFSFTFSHMRDGSFHDFPTLANENYSSYLVTGYEVAGMPSNKKWSPYIVCHFRRTEMNVVDGVFDFPSSCFVQSRWDWTGSPASGKWGVPQQVYRLLRYSVMTENGVFDYGQDVITTKPRIGGSGRALSLKFESEEGKDFHLYGWSINASANAGI